MRIVTDAAIGSPPDLKIEQVSTDRVHNHTRIEIAMDIDGELGKGLARGYGLMG